RVVVLLGLTQPGDVEAFLTDEQSDGRSVGDVGEASRITVTNDACLFPVARGIVAQRGDDGAAVQVSRITERGRLRAAAGGAEVNRVGRAHGEAGPIEIVRGAAAAPGALAFQVGENLEAPARLLRLADQRRTLVVGGGAPPVPAAGREEL